MAGSEDRPQSVRDTLTAVMNETSEADESAEAVSSGQDDGQPEPAADAPATPDVEAPAAESDPEAVTEPEQAEAPAEDDPDALDPDDKLWMDSLPIRHRNRAEAWRREIKRGAQAKFDAAAEARKGLEEIDQALEPYSAGMRQAGQTRAQVVSDALKVVSRMSEDPAGTILALAGKIGTSQPDARQAEEFVRQVAAKLGVKFGTSGQDAQIPSGQPDTPEARRIAALEAKIAEQERRDREAEERELRRSLGDSEARLAAFSTAKGNDGSLKYPLFDKVRHDMAALMFGAAQVNQEMSLEDAYERAIWARGDLRPDLLKAQRDAEAKAAAATQREAIAKARAAATPRTANVGVPDARDSGGSVRQTLERVMEELGTPS